MDIVNGFVYSPLFYFFLILGAVSLGAGIFLRVKNGPVMIVTTGTKAAISILYIYIIGIVLFQEHSNSAVIQGLPFVGDPLSLPTTEKPMACWSAIFMDF